MNDRLFLEEVQLEGVLHGQGGPQAFEGCSNIRDAPSDCPFCLSRRSFDGQYPCWGVLEPEFGYRRLEQRISSRILCNAADEVYIIGKH